MVNGCLKIYQGIACGCVSVIQGGGVPAAIQVVKAIETTDNQLWALGPLPLIGAHLVTELQGLISRQLAHQFGKTKLLTGITAGNTVATAILEGLVVTLADRHQGTPVIAQPAKGGTTGFVAIGIGERTEFNQGPGVFAWPQHVFGILGDKAD